MKRIINIVKKYITTNKYCCNHRKFGIHLYALRFETFGYNVTVFRNIPTKISSDIMTTLENLNIFITDIYVKIYREICLLKKCLQL